jgi:glucokinase
VLAADIGGTSIRAAVLSISDKTVSILDSIKFETKPERGFHSAMDELALNINGIAKRQQIDLKTTPLGVASAGPISIYEGIYDMSPNLPNWKGFGVSQYLQSKIGSPTVTAHDGAMAVLAESRIGTHKDKLNIIYLTVSTGIGAGLMTNGKLVVGHNSGAGEAGHIIINRGGRSCKNGCKGCLEGSSSGSAIADIAQKKLRYTPNSILSEVDQLITAADVVAAAKRNDPLATEIISDVLSNLSSGLASLLALFDPEALILGGGVIEGLAPWWTELLRKTQETALPRYKDSLPLFQTSLSGNAPIIGAAIFANDYK